MYSFDSLHYNSDFSPKLCRHCGCDQFKDVTVATDGGFVSEFEMCCYGCGTRVAYWAYGHFDPCFVYDEC